MKIQGTRIVFIRILSAIFLVLATTAAQAVAVGLHETDVTFSGGILTITDDNGGSSNDNLTLSYAGGTYTLTDTGGLPIDVSTIAGSTGDGTSTVTFPDTGINSIVFNLLGGDDLVTVDSVQPSFSDNFTITGGAGLDRAAINANIATTGSGAINVTVSGNIVLNSGSSLTTVDGGITLDANVAGAQTADFIGLDANNAMIQTTGAGDIQLLGKGADIGGDTPSTYGVRLQNGTSVSSTATGATAGKITINGIGGDGLSNNYGVDLGFSAGSIASVDGDILINGMGGDGTTGNHGVSVLSNITSTGVGSEAATVTIVGTSGTGTNSNQGVSMVSASAQITSVDGDIAITGMSNGSGSQNRGVYAFNNSQISSTGTGAEAATITVNGTTGGNDNSPAVVLATSFMMTSVAGDIQINGTSSGTGGLTSGISVGGFSTIQVTSASLTLHGITPVGAPNANGVALSANLISLGSGPISIIGEGGVLDIGIGVANIGDGTHIGAPTPATGDITITADSFRMASTSSIESDGALTVQPRTAGTTIALGYFSSSSGGALTLSDSELTYLQDGFSSIIIGNSDAGSINVQSAIFNDPLILLTADEINNSLANPNITNNGNTTTFNGNLAPGQTFNVMSNAAFADNSTFTASLWTATTSAFHDKLTATGSVTIGNDVNLIVDTSLYNTHESGVITIIENGSGPVSGTFSGLPEGAQTNPGNAFNFIISYVGGDGNDVTLTAASPTSITSIDVSTTTLPRTADLVLMILAGGLGLLSLLFVWWRRRSMNGS